MWSLRMTCLHKNWLKTRKKKCWLNRSICHVEKRWALLSSRQHTWIIFILVVPFKESGVQQCYINNRVLKNKCNEFYILYYNIVFPHIHITFSFTMIMTCKYNFVILLLIRCYILRNSLSCLISFWWFLVIAKLSITGHDHSQMNYIINRTIYMITDLFMYI